MKKKIFLKIITRAAILLILIKHLALTIIEPLIRGRIVAAMNNANSGYLVKIEKVHLSLIKAGVELNGITISKGEPGLNIELNGGIGSVKLHGMHLLKALFKHNIHIRTVTSAW